MIIPKATFLNTTFKKSKNEFRHALHAEKVKLKSEVISALRVPQNHKLGKIVFILTDLSYPLLCKRYDESIVEELIVDLELAGYKIELITERLAKKLSWL